MNTSQIAKCSIGEIGCNVTLRCVTLHKNGIGIFNNLYLDRKEIL